MATQAADTYSICTTNIYQLFWAVLQLHDKKKKVLVKTFSQCITSLL